MGENATWKGLRLGLDIFLQVLGTNEDYNFDLLNLWLYARREQDDHEGDILGWNMYIHSKLVRFIIGPLQLGS